jgi:hypothetical protein
MCCMFAIDRIKLRDMCFAWMDHGWGTRSGHSNGLVGL